MTIRTIHRTTAFLVATFVAFHLANHLVGIGGYQAHRDVMDVLRTVYRFTPIEIVLIVGFAVQVVTGVRLFFAGLRRRHGAFAWVQATSGLVVGCFIAIHVAAIFYGRETLGLDTNLHYAAAGLHVAGARSFFAPYYFIGVFALFVHIGCAAARWCQRRAARTASPRPNPWIAVCACAGVGACLALALVLMMRGSFAPIEIPASYLRTFEAP